MQVRGNYRGEDRFYTASESDLDSNENTLSVYEPAGIFEKFTYGFSAYNNIFDYYRYDEDQLPGSYDIPTSADISVITPTISNFRGFSDYPRDYSYVNGSNYDPDQEVPYISQRVYTSGDQEIQFFVPEVPKAVADEYPSVKERMRNLSWNYLALRNQDNVSSFKEYAAKLYKKDSELYAYKTSERISFRNQEDANARRAVQELPQRVQDELKEHEARR